MGLLDMIENSVIEAARFYTWNSPIRRGKGRVYQTALAVCRSRPRERAIRLADGRRLSMNYSLGQNDHVVFVGEYEPFLTQVCRELIEEGDVCVDVGANFGWYTTLFATLVGEPGEVHAFEPIAEAFANLETNVGLLPDPTQVKVNRIALGDSESEIVINVFTEIGLGYSSVADQGRRDAVPQKCRMTTLDAYWAGTSGRDLNFLKADVEGAELMMLHGARSILAQDRPPVMLLELSEILTRNLGYLPTDVISFLAENAEYKFYAADETRNVLRPLDHRPGSHVSANVFCIPANLSEPRRRRLSKFVE